MSSGASSFHSTLVNAYAGALISVSQTVGVDVVFLKSDITPGVNAPGSRVAALIGIIGAGVHSTVAVMADEKAFEGVADRKSVV